MRKFQGLLLLGSSALILSGCGAGSVASPGASGNVTIVTPAPAPAPTATPTPTGVTPAGGCPTIATDQGTITGPTGTYRVCRLPNLISTSISLPKVAGLKARFPQLWSDKPAG